MTSSPSVDKLQVSHIFPLLSTVSTGPHKGQVYTFSLTPILLLSFEV